MDSIDSTRIRRIFDLLGRGIHGRTEIHVAGSIPTLIKGLTARPTGDIDLVMKSPSATAPLLDSTLTSGSDGVGLESPTYPVGVQQSVGRSDSHRRTATAGRAPTDRGGKRRGTSSPTRRTGIA